MIVKTTKHILARDTSEQECRTPHGHRFASRRPTGLLIDVKNAVRINALLSKVACLLPLLWLIVDIVFDNLGANPLEALHSRLGNWSLRFLCLTLAITPVQRMTSWRGMADYRQLFGLCAFFYASLHLLVYLRLDHAFAWRAMAVEVIESSFIWFGILAYGIIFLLALTSPKRAKRRMGKNWKKLHRFVYLAAVAAVMHYFWQLKGNLAEPLLYAMLLFLLMAFRILSLLKKRQLNSMTIRAERRALAVAKKQAEAPETVHNPGRPGSFE